MALGKNELYAIFYEVVNARSFTAAATALHITQSAVSQQVRNLEQNVGASLLDRSNRRSVRLTQAGEIVYDHVRRMLQLESEMRRRLDDAASVVHGALHIGASYTIGEYILPALLAEFWDLYPEIDPHVEIQNSPAVVAAVNDRRMDVGLVESAVTDAGACLVEEFAHDELVLIVPARHPLAKRTTVSPEELVDETWIVREVGSGARDLTERLFQEHEVHPRRMMAFSSAHGVKEAVRVGLGIAFLSSWALQADDITSTIRVIPLQNVLLARPLSLITRSSGSVARSARVFVDFIRKRSPVIAADPRSIHVRTSDSFSSHE